ncbi:hypothetical protein E6O75_ATG00638 [Venturia nashicola]|uniref:Uncharacterized protein n=1 Tax=Venturia nashicola TaxID=86259 RepID=A0A4Z1PEE1_9PEZI|nr:hypothetical protein E6O75_ATG00638 [Venturia nashicola]
MHFPKSKSTLIRDSFHRYPITLISELDLKILPHQKYPLTKLRQLPLFKSIRQPKQLRIPQCPLTNNKTLNLFMHQNLIHPILMQRKRKSIITIPIFILISPFLHNLNRRPHLSIPLVALRPKLFHAFQMKPPFLILLLLFPAFEDEFAAFHVASKGTSVSLVVPTFALCP